MRLGYRSPSGDGSALGFPVYMSEVHLPLVCGAVLCDCLVGSCVSPHSRRNGLRRWARGGLTTGLGLSVFPSYMGLRFSWFCEFVSSLSAVAFFGLHVCGGYWFVGFRPVVSL